jgi:predicted metal-dependent enzyme (double-stranded beta helix superfamily)
MATIGVISADLKPSEWDPKLDAVVAAPGNHLVIYEDDLIRVLSVTVAPGETEPVHHHRWPSVFVLDRLAKLRNFDGAGREIPVPIPENSEYPVVLKLPPKPSHAIRNEDVTTCHGIRIEFKNGFTM